MSNPDDDRAFDIDPDGDAAAYDEWAALAGEPARTPSDHPQRDFADNQASFAAIASSLTKTQTRAASHPGSMRSVTSLGSRGVLEERLGAERQGDHGVGLPKV